MSISPKGGARGLKRLVSFKDYIVLRWESRFKVTAFKDQYVQNLIMYKNGKLDSLWGSMQPKIHITSKKIEIKVVQH